MPNNSENAPRFAPDDPTDGRGYGEWKPRYEPDAAKRILVEAVYLACHLVLVPIVFIVLGIVTKNVANQTTSQASSQHNRPDAVASQGVTGDAPAAEWPQLVYAWAGGILGGTLFSIKWLYHSVAKHIWNADRRLWRFFTPHLSGALAFVFVVLAASRLIAIFDAHAFRSVWVCFGLGFLVGYFSDSAVAKLSEIAQTLFGSSK